MGAYLVLRGRFELAYLSIISQLPIHIGVRRIVVRILGLQPRRFAAIDPKSIVSSNSTISAYGASEGPRSLNPFRAMVFKTILYTNSNTLAYYCSSFRAANTIILLCNYYSTISLICQYLFGIVYILFTNYFILP